MSENLDLICYSLAALTLAVPGLFLVARWAWRKWRGRKVGANVQTRILRAAKDEWRRYGDAPTPQPGAPYGSKPDPDDAPVSRRELERILSDYARLDAIEKPVKKCGRCLGGGRLWVQPHSPSDGVVWVPCNRCNGTGRED